MVIHKRNMRTTSPACFYIKFNETENTVDPIVIYVCQSVIIGDDGLVVEDKTIHLGGSTSLKELANKMLNFDLLYQSSSIDLNETSWGDNGSELVLIGRRLPTAEELNLFNQLKVEYEEQEGKVKADGLREKELAELQRLKEKYE